MKSRIKSLCKHAKKGDKAAAQELLMFFYSDVYVYLRRLCGSNQDAEDLTQQTFFKVWLSLNSFAGRSKFSTWLYRIAYNTYIDWRRGNAGQVRYRSDQWWYECEDDNPDPLANAAERQLAQRLYEAVDRLDEDKKHAVHLHYYQGLSIRQTADVLGIATSTVKYRLREVFKVLRRKIDIDQDTFKQEQIIPIGKGELI
jgi:RNA polymerase sigma-70 factor (ECF subfamily)